MDASLLPFFQPRGVVVIGTSTSPEKLGYGVARNLVQSGYQGGIHLVGQREGTLFNRQIYTELSQVPDPVDLAVLILPPEASPSAIRSCAARGIKAAIIVASGFREAGSEGAAVEEECLTQAREGNVRLLGPNCIGVINTSLPLDTTFLQSGPPAEGNIGFISHSGAFCAAIIDWAPGQGIGFSKIISLGNQADVNETDILAALAEDEETRVIAFYLEDVADGRRFVRVAAEVTRRKPVIALKVARSTAGMKAAFSHTGAMAGSEAAFDAAFEKAGVLRAGTAEQLFDWARALVDCPPLEGSRVAILTDAGGPGVIAADSLEANGLRLAQLERATQAALSAHLPPAASVRNPVDMLASASPEDYSNCLRLSLEDPGVDAALVILPPPPMHSAESVAQAMLPVIQASAKPVVVALLGSVLVAGAARVFRRARIPTFPFPERAMSALGALFRRSRYVQQRPQRVASPLLQPGTVSEQRGAADSSPEALLASYGIQTAPLLLARSADEAATLSSEVGFPLVLKIATPDLPHKSDVGGVMLGITSPSACHQGFLQLVEHVRKARPHAILDGVSLQRQVPPGQDVIVSMIRDPQFGPLLMFGSGGIEVEGLKDTAFALAPLSPAEAAQMISRTWAGEKLRGYRSMAPADRQAVQDVLVQLSRLAIDQPEIEELEINPLRVLEMGAVALDVRVRTAGTG